MSIQENTKSYCWQDQYEAAILETDATRILGRIVSAQAAVNLRLGEIQANYGAVDSEEKQALIDAMNGLQFLRKSL